MSAEGIASVVTADLAGVFTRKATIRGRCRGLRCEGGRKGGGGGGGVGGGGEREERGGVGGSGGWFVGNQLHTRSLASRRKSTWFHHAVVWTISAFGS